MAERRQVDVAMNLLMEKLDKHMTANESFQREMRRDVRCLHEGFTEFKETYEPLLMRALTSNKFWSKVRDDMIVKGANITVGALLLAALGMMAFGAKDWIHKWLQ